MAIWLVDALLRFVAMGLIYVVVLLIVVRRFGRGAAPAVWAVATGLLATGGSISTIARLRATPGGTPVGFGTRQVVVSMVLFAGFAFGLATRSVARRVGRQPLSRLSVILAAGVGAYLGGFVLAMLVLGIAELTGAM